MNIITLDIHDCSLLFDIISFTQLAQKCKDWVVVFLAWVEDLLCVAFHDNYY